MEWRLIDQPLPRPAPRLLVLPSTYSFYRVLSFLPVPRARCRHEERRGTPAAVVKTEAHTALRSSAFHLCTCIFRLSSLPDRSNRLPPEDHCARRERHLCQPPRCHSQVSTSAGLAQPRLTTFIRQTKYLGIPYAHPPTGALRFRPPVPYTELVPTNGTLRPVRSAHAFGPSCPQSTPVPYSISEDCLTLNVWVPHVPRALQFSLGEEIAKGLPVLVWICVSIFNVLKTNLT